MVDGGEAVGVGLIGVGGWGASHVRSILAVGEMGWCRWVGACDRDAARFGQWQAELDRYGVRRFDDVDRMLGELQGQADLIGIAVGIGYHAELSIRCMEAGYHVICEKPPAATIQEVNAMTAAAERCGKRCIIHFQGCWSGSFLRLRKLICRGELGRIRAVRAAGRWLRADTYYGRNAWAGKMRDQGRWVLDGTINNPFSHLVNAALHLASADPDRPAMPKRVRAELYHCRDIGGEDTSCLAIETEAGVMIETFFTVCSEQPLKPVRLRVIGEKGTADVADDRITVKFVGGGQKVIGQDGRDARRSVYEDTCRFLVAGEPPVRCPVANTRGFVLAINGAFESAGGTRAVPQRFVRCEPYEESVVYRLRGVDELIERGFEGGESFSGLGAPWAASTDWFDLAGYQRFEPTFSCQ